MKIRMPSLEEIKNAEQYCEGECTVEMLSEEESKKICDSVESFLTPNTKLQPISKIKSIYKKLLFFLHIT